jgi:hypothetical protein
MQGKNEIIGGYQDQRKIMITYSNLIDNLHIMRLYLPEDYQHLIGRTSELAEELANMALNKPTAICWYSESTTKEKENDNQS